MKETANNTHLNRRDIQYVSTSWEKIIFFCHLIGKPVGFIVQLLRPHQLKNDVAHYYGKYGKYLCCQLKPLAVI